MRTKTFIICIGFFTLFTIKTHTIQAQVVKSDSLELIKLYKATNGHKWKRKKWDLSRPVHTWPGIKLKSNGRSVKIINLHNNNLTGIIPDLRLPNLERLFLFNNKLKGSIPDFDNLPNLEILSLYQNKLSGPIPNFDLPKLMILTLDNNQLTGSIPNFNLPNLEYLQVFKNKLSGLIPNFNHLPNLEIFDLRYNFFTFQGVKENLAIPYFCYENQDKIPISYIRYENKVSVNAGGDIEHNTYYWSKDEIAYDTIQGDSVLVVSEPGIYSCRVTNSVITKPNESWRNFVLESEQVVVEKIQKLSCIKNDSLELIKLYKTTNGANWTQKWDLSKPVYTWHGVKLTSDNCNVKSINLVNNQLSGSIPNLNLPRLVFLTLSNNKLDGTIPNFDLPELVVLTLYGNKLSGSIPNFNLLKLRRLGLASNKLSGNIPNFNNLLDLKSLDLSHNQLSGTIPNFDLPVLNGISLSYNQLSGTIPNFNLSQLWYLSVSHNKLSGAIPNFQDGSTKLQNLQLSYNSFTFQGIEQNLDIPVFFYEDQDTISLYRDKSEENRLYVKAGGDMKKNIYSWYRNGQLYKIVLGDSVIVAVPGTYYCKVINNVITRVEGFNQNLVLQSEKVKIEDTEPVLSLNKSDSLELIKLYKATNGAHWKNKWDLTKPVSSWYGIQLTSDSSHVQHIDLNYNLLSGTIPNLNLPELLYLDLSYNELSGGIPNFDLPKLKYLYLATNSLTGTVPNFDKLPKLEHLYFPSNRLSGSIPNFDHLPNLTHLWLWGDGLSGSIPNFDHLPNLVDLNLNNNNLNGDIPNFDHLPKLSNMWLFNNQLSGTVPNYNHLQKLSSLQISYNYFTFQGIATNLKIPEFSYEHQDTIPLYPNKENVLYVKAGGGVKNNTYNWYKDGKLYKTIVGDSVFIPIESGTYYCKITNSIVTRPQGLGQNLVLQSNSKTISVKIPEIDIFKSVVQEKQQGEIIFFPNPAKESVSIDLKKAKKKRVDIQVLDRFGGVHMKRSILFTDETIKLNVRSLSDGYYYVRIQVEGKPEIVKPLIIAH